MSFAPASITKVMAVWTSNGGVNLGIVGDTSHVATGTSYHLGKDHLVAGAYSAALARDKAGLSNAASALDFGRLHGSLVELQKFSNWLVARCKANAAGTSDIREIIFSPDGKVVKRWDNNAKVLYAGGTGTGQGDDSHITHTHISFFRDSEFRDKTGLLTPYFASIPVPAPAPAPIPIGENMAILVVAEDWTLAGGVDRPLRSEPIRSLNEGTYWKATERGPRTIGEHKSADGNDWRLTARGWLLRGDLIAVTPGGDPALRGKFTDFLAGKEISAPDAAACETFTEAAYASGKTDGIVVGETTGAVKGAAAEKGRLRSLLGL